MEQPIIEVKNIGKEYDITHQRGGYVSLRDVLMNVLKSPFSFLKHKVKQAAGFEKKENFWALKDVNFTVNKGEVVGIIGRNGAGKSTLLKILSQITPPTTGEIKIHGRVGSLLEVGTGFHPELTGRENIFLNGAILGMKKKEIEKKFDEIVAFSGIGKFLDTPVKHYSSGMYVRLAFSVAAHMEPDILIIDEVLAVGDAEFQKKCMGKMEDITQKEGRTIIFVSHNLDAIQQLCKRAVLLEDGKIKMIGETKKIIDGYLGSARLGPKVIIPNIKSDTIAISSIEFINISDTPWFLHFKENLKIKLTLHSKKRVENFRLGIGINGTAGERISTVHSDPNLLREGVTSFEVELQNNLTPGRYSLSFGSQNLFYIPEIILFEVGGMGKQERHQEMNYGFVNIDTLFTIVHND